MLTDVLNTIGDFILVCLLGALMGVLSGIVDRHTKGCKRKRKPKNDKRAMTSALRETARREHHADQDLEKKFYINFSSPPQF